MNRELKTVSPAARLVFGSFAKSQNTWTARVSLSLTPKAFSNRSPCISSSHGKHMPVAPWLSHSYTSRRFKERIFRLCM
jgi:hypothetical protein